MENYETRYCNNRKEIWPIEVFVIFLISKHFFFENIIILVSFRIDVISLQADP